MDSISQHCCRYIEALLLHGETRPMTGLPARATSATSKFAGRYAVGGANRSLWPNSEFHEESLPAMPTLLLSRVHHQSITGAHKLNEPNVPALRSKGRNGDQSDKNEIKMTDKMFLCISLYRFVFIPWITVTPLPG
jgi:hypothetical protein